MLVCPLDDVAELALLDTGLSRSLELKQSLLSICAPRELVFQVSINSNSIISLKRHVQV